MSGVPFPVIPLAGATPVPKCAIDEAPAWGVIEVVIEVMPVWSLADEDRDRTIARIGLCRECTVRLSAGDTLTSRILDVEYAPKSATPTLAALPGLP